MDFTIYKYNISRYPTNIFNKYPNTTDIIKYILYTT